MLFTSAIVLPNNLCVCLVHSYTYLSFTTTSPLYGQLYAFSRSLVGLTDLGFGIGCAVGLLV